MSAIQRFSGVLAPVIMPFDAGLAVDAKRLIQQCHWLLEQQVSIAVFGTNSEANSLSVEEKIDLLDALVAAGIDPARLMPGTGLCALTDTVKLTRHATKIGCPGVLMLPPFFYKGVSDDGLYRSYAEVIERTGSDRLGIYLYHIPPVSQVGLSLPLVEKLIRAYPDTILGIKDSSGDWNNTLAMLDAGWDDFRIFAGSEAFLLQTMQHGGAGCISATANINPAAIHELYLSWNKAEAIDLQQKLVTLREWVQRYPVIPALKSIVAHFSGDPNWQRVRPPLLELTPEQRHALIDGLQKFAFHIPGLRIN